MATSGRSGAFAMAPVRRRVAGDHERRQVAGGPARDEAASGSSGRPACAASTPRAWFSATTTPAASSQDVPCSDEHETNMSKSSEAFVGAAGMNDRKRGLSHETTAVDSLSTKSFSTWAASLPSGRHEAGQLGVERVDEAAEVEGDRVHGQAFPAGREDQVRHRLVVVEHRTRHQARGSSGSRRRAPGGAPGLLGPAGDLVQRWRRSWRPRAPRRRTPAWPARRSTFMRTVMPSTVTWSSCPCHGPALDRGGTDPHRPGDPLDLGA